MDPNTTDRKAFLQNMKEFINTSKATLDSILTQLEWTRESLHVSPAREPLTKTETVTKEENGAEGLEGTGLVPVEDQLSDVLSAIKEVRAKEKSEAEILTEKLEAERDAKRRRVSYRNKVHTKNKSHTEVLRELVHQQMEVITGESTSAQPERNTDEELIPVGTPVGNPHLFWQRVAILVAEDHEENEEEANVKEGRDRHKKRERTDHRHRSERKHRSRDRSRHRHRSRDRRREMDDRRKRSRSSSGSRNHRTDRKKRSR